MTTSLRDRLLTKLRPLAALVFIHIPRPIIRAAKWFTAIAVLLLAALVLTLRYYVLPEVAAYRPQIEAQLSSALKLPIRIEEVSADWAGLRPHLAIRGLQLLDQEGRMALRLDQVDAEVGWMSLVTASLRLARLEHIM